MSDAPALKPWTRLFKVTHIAPLVQIRVALGLILLWEAYRYISYGWPRRLFLDPPFLFKYYGFEWVRPLPETLHLAVFPLLGALAVAFTIGLLYRVSAILLFLGWAYVFLLDQALYLNHLYLVVMAIGLMALLPAQRAFSLDALWRPRLYSSSVPSWTIDILRFQIAVVYFFGGVAKLNADWLSGVPMQMMLLGSPHIFGEWAGEPIVARLFAYGGLLFDLGIVPLLCWKRTRLLALGLATFFHVANHILFQIGIFPWAMLAATYILWPPFRLSMLNFARLYGGLVLAGMFITVIFHPPGVPGRPVEPWAWLVAIVLTAIFVFPPDSWRQFPFERQSAADSSPVKGRPLVLALLIIFGGYQILMPLRHLLYPGDVSWTEEGHKWAWHMKLRVKVAERAVFSIRDEQGRVLEVFDPFAFENLLTEERLDVLNSRVESGETPPGPLLLTDRQADTLSTRPDMALEFAHHLRDRAQLKYNQPVQITIENPVSLNGRPFQYLIDPEENLAAVEERLWPPADWIEPLATPRRPLTRVDVDEIDVDRVDALFDYIEAGELDSDD